MWLSRTLQHHFNPLHLFCRLRRLGLGKKAALRLARLYERYLYRT